MNLLDNRVTIRNPAASSIQNYRLPMTILNPPLPDKQQIVTWSRLHGSSRGLAIAEAARKSESLLVIVLEDQHQLQVLESEIKYFIEDENTIPVASFPGWECLPYDNFSPHQEIVSQRLRLLGQLPEMQKGIVLVHVSDLMQRLPPPDYVLSHTFSVVRNQKIDLEQLRSKLISSNYVSVNQVMSPGEFTVRGGLIDIFPSGASTPFRLDLFDDELESIRLFDPETQLSSETVESIELLPAREFPMTEEGINKFRGEFRRKFEGDPRQQSIYTDISMGITPPGCEFFFPLFYDETASFFDYLNGNSIFVLDSEHSEFSNTFWAEIQDRYSNANLDISRKVLPTNELYLNPDELNYAIDQFPRICISHSSSGSKSWIAATGLPGEFPVDPAKDSPYAVLVDHIKNSTNRIMFIAETPGRREALDGILLNNGLQSRVVSRFGDFLNSDIQLGLNVALLERGMVLTEHALEVICESQLYGERVYQRRQRTQKSRDPDSIIKSLAELNIGDPVVHIDHGVGRYLGLQILNIEGANTEFLALEYQNGDKLYIPVLDLNLISRFIGGSPDLAPLHRLGGDQWDKAKKRAKEKAYDVATELLEVEALRNTRSGMQFECDETDLESFRSQFPFEETPDQQQVIDDVLKDLNSPEPMDRLVCGDVGFGKTEVALRAAFVVVSNHRQVTVLTPTTLLAQQHFQTFSDRFADWPVNIAVLSRFNTRKQSQETLENLNKGLIDIVIGTHRLLQDDIKFSDLGLLIIDEEHRFGVRQKEKIKRLRSEVDILTLTATPIPRTLNITMSGLRSISIIASPPINRLAIKTFVREWSPGLIREACVREIRRGGQVFFLHNEVKTIERMALELGDLIPEAEIAIAHGQLGEVQLERIMQDFYHQRFNLLLCSTIIESGIDIPSANTIIINRADKFGLAQLHQLRGRVGRSHHQAFAYLLTPNKESITRDARKRLDAITSMEDLGAGFALASHDLEIRGAGELLGETQSGLIDDVGFSLYSEYLSLAVKAIKRGDIPDPDNLPEVGHSTSIDLHLPALFPDDYLNNPHTRLILYKRISGARSLEELEELQVEVVDRFGLLPELGKNLFQLTGFRILGETLGITKIDIGPQGGLIEFEDNPNLDPTGIFSLIQEHPDRFRFSGPNSLSMSGEYEDHGERIEAVRSLMKRLKSENP